MLRPPEPVLVVDRFPVESSALFELIERFTPADWRRQTIAGEWTVKDVLAHLVGDDLGLLSRQRDRYDDGSATAKTLKDLIDRRNAEWVLAMRRLSPLVLRSLLEWSRDGTQRFFESLDPFATSSGGVSWAGLDAAPVWLDIARELTERWHHQQQMRDAVGAGPLTMPALMQPVLATFAHALPVAMKTATAPAGAVLTLRVAGPSGGDWSVRRDHDRWSLWLGRNEEALAEVEMDQETAWRMYVGVLPLPEIERRAVITGDADLGRQLLTAFALVS